MVRIQRFLVASLLSLGAIIVIVPLATAGDSDVVAGLKDQGYVAVPIKRGADRRLYVDGRVHGETLSFLIDFTSEGLLFDTRTLRKVGIELTKTSQTIPTRRKTVTLETGEILGLEFGGKSTPRMTIVAGDVDAIYNVPPGVDGHDGAIGSEFLKRLGGVLDFSTMTLYLKPR